MGATPRIGRLMVITDIALQRRFDHHEIAERAVAGGADTIQFREKTLRGDELVAAARRVRAVCARAGVAMIVNDSVELARAVGADGVHLGRSDTPVPKARAALGPGAIIGGTAGTLEAALEAEAAGADYVGFGHIFATTSKHKPGPPVGLEALARVCMRVEIPVVAIGGITSENAAAVYAAGAWCVAVIGAVSGSDDPEAAARRLRARVPAA